MKTKQKMKIAVDVAMTLALLFLMGYQFWGEALHEWIGTAMLLLFLFHHILNGSWHKNLGRGKYTPYRISILCVDILVFVSMFVQMYSGVVMSRHVFAILDINGGMALARRLHILGAYWGFALISLHFGMHWSMIAGMMKRAIPQKMQNRVGRFSAIVIADVLAGYGLYAFISRGLLDNMLLKNEFVFMDFSESKLLFYFDYMAMAVLFALFGHLLAKAAKKITETKRTELSA